MEANVPPPLDSSHTGTHTFFFFKLRVRAHQRPANHRGGYNSGINICPPIPLVSHLMHRRTCVNYIKKKDQNKNVHTLPTYTFL